MTNQFSTMDLMAGLASAIIRLAPVGSVVVELLNPLEPLGNHVMRILRERYPESWMMPCNAYGAAVFICEQAPMVGLDLRGGDLQEALVTEYDRIIDSRQSKEDPKIRLTMPFTIGAGRTDLARTLVRDYNQKVADRMVAARREYLFEPIQVIDRAEPGVIGIQFPHVVDAYNFGRLYHEELFGSKKVKKSENITWFTFLRRLRIHISWNPKETDETD